MSIEPSQLLSKAKVVLNLMGIHRYTNLQLTLATKVFNEWRVNFSYMEEGSIIAGMACFAVDAESGEMRGMWLDRAWK